MTYHAGNGYPSNYPQDMMWQQQSRSNETEIVHLHPSFNSNQLHPHFYSHHVEQHVAYPHFFLQSAQIHHNPAPVMRNPILLQQAMERQLVQEHRLVQGHRLPDPFLLQQHVEGQL
eukprot:64873-Hanusia_phi.AAC.1